MNEEKPFLDKMNDRFKRCLKLDKLFEIAETKLKAEIDAELQRRFGINLDRNNPNIPEEVFIDPRYGTKDIYINGVRTVDGERIPVVHVSLHLEPNNIQDIVGAIHGKSNTRDGEFIRFFFDYFDGRPKLVTFGYEGWKMAMKNIKKYNTLTIDSQRDFIKIVFNAINKYLSEAVISEEECLPVMQAKAEPNREPAKAPAQEAQAEAPAKEAPAPRVEIASGPKVVLEPLSAEESKLLKSFLEFYRFYKIGLESGYYTFLRPVKLEEFLNFNIMRRTDLYYEYFTHNIKSIETILSDIDISLKSLNTLPKTPENVNRAERLKSITTFQASYKSHFLEFISLFERFEQAFNEYYEATGNESIRYLLPYMSDTLKEIETHAKNTSILTKTNIQAWLDLLPEKKWESTLSQIKEGGFQAINLYFTLAIFDLDINQVNLQILDKQMEIFNERLKSDKAVFKGLQNEYKVQNETQEENKLALVRFEQEKKSIEEQIGSETKEARKKKLKDLLKVTNGRIEAMRSAIESFPNLIKLTKDLLPTMEAQIQKGNEKMMERFRTKTQKQKKIDLQKKTVKALYDIQQAKFPSESFSPIYLTVLPTLQGGSRRKTRRHAHKKRRLTRRKN